MPFHATLLLNYESATESPNNIRSETLHVPLDTGLNTNDTFLVKHSADGKYYHGTVQGGHLLLDGSSPNAYRSHMYRIKMHGLQK